MTDDHPGDERPFVDLPGEPRPRTVISTTPWEVDARHEAEVTRMLAADRRRQRLPWVVLGVLAAIAGLIVAAVGLMVGDDKPKEADSVTLSSAEVTTRNIVQLVDFPGELSYAGNQELVSPVASRVTTIASTGDELGRGDVVALLDQQPLVLMYGDEPFARPLAVGDRGSDVEQLEANLAALGFDADGSMSVDTDYTAETARAVRAWQASIGARATGDVPLGRVVAASGLVAVLDALTPGVEVQAGERLALVEIRRRLDDVVQPGPGVATQLLAPGAPIRHGDQLLVLDDLPVVAVTEPSDVTSAVLDALAADDIEKLESLLVFFGLDPDGLVVIDGVADLATLAAFGRWEIAVGLPETFAVGAPYFVELPDGTVVDEVHLAEGQAIDGGALAYTVGRSTLSVSAEVAGDDVERFSEGDDVTVELADGTVLDARVSGIAQPAAASGSAGAAASSTTVTFTLRDEPAQVAAGPVTVHVEGARVDGATVVPGRAVVSLPGGRSAIRIQRDDGSTELVEVELGLYDADGYVEVISDDVTAGDVVMFPA